MKYSKQTTIPARDGYWVYPKNRPAYFKPHKKPRASLHSKAMSAEFINVMLAGAGLVLAYFGLIMLFVM